jgi:hypothetical protein
VWAEVDCRHSDSGGSFHDVKRGSLSGAECAPYD